MQILTLHRKYLFYVGLDFKKINKFPYSLLKWIYTGIMSYTIVPQATYLYNNRHDMTKFIADVTPFATCLAVWTKYLLLRISIRKLEKIFDILQDFEKYFANQGLSKKFEKVENEAKRISKLFIWFMLVGCSNLYVLGLIGADLYKYSQTAKEDYVPVDAFHNMYLFNNYGFPWYYICLLMAGLCPTAGCTMLTLTEITFLSMCTYIVGLFKNLNEMLIKCDEVYEEEGIPALKAKIRQCAHLHIQILNFVHTVVSYYSPLIFLQYWASFMAIIPAIFQSTYVRDSDLIAIASFTSSFIGELFLYCWFATKVSDECANVQQNVYNIKWYNYPKAQQKVCIFMMTQTRHPVVFHGFGLVNCNVEMFIYIFNSTISACTVLRSLREG